MPAPVRIAIAGFQHESHSFTDHRADFAYFEEHRDRPPLVRGREILSALEGGSYALSGFMAAQRGGVQLVPLVWASGGAGGDVTSDAFERIVGELTGDLSRQMPVDAVYLDLHGAMVSQDFDDAEGELLRRVRAVVGPHTPVVISLDYHANISPEMVRLCDGMAVFRTYPHVDRPQTGRRAAEILHAILDRGCLPAGRALRKTPFLLPLDFQCTLVEPSASVVGWKPENAAGLVSVCYAAGFPPSDTVWCGPSVVVHAWTQEAADAMADAYLADVLRLEMAFALPLWSTADGIREALSLARGTTRPVVIADTQDNPGAGGSGNTTGILRALMEAGAEDAMIGYFCDAEAAAAAHRAGEGAAVELSLGSAERGSVPVSGRFEVVRCAEGPFRMTGSVAGNVIADLGQMALLRCGGIQIAVTSRRVQAYDPAPFERLGVDPRAHRILVLKSSCHFRADFSAFAEKVLTVLSPGSYDPDPAHYPYTRLRRGVRYLPGRAEAHGAGSAAEIEEPGRS